MSALTLALHSYRNISVSRTIIVAMTLMGWVVLANHCALGRMAQSAQTQKEHACCHNDAPKPLKDPTDGDRGMQCCKSLRALIPDGTKTVAPTPPMVAVAILTATPAGEARTRGPAAVETGPPPRAATFSELVLHRSLRSHAPPRFA